MQVDETGLIISLAAKSGREGVEESVRKNSNVGGHTLISIVFLAAKPAGRWLPGLWRGLVGACRALQHYCFGTPGWSDHSQ